MNWEVSSPEEFGVAVEEWKNLIRTTANDSGRPPLWSLGAGTRVSNGHGTLMAHCYDSGHLTCVHSLVIYAKFHCDQNAFFSLPTEFGSELLDDGYAVMVQDGTHISHLLHRGPRWVSFGLRTTDEEAMLMMLKHTGYSLMKIDGPYMRAKS